MFENQTFQAPWGRSLKIATLLSSLFLTVIFVFGAYYSGNMSPVWKSGMILLPFVTIGISALFTIRSYRILENQLIIQRIGWQSTIDLGDLKSAEANPKAMSKSLRLFGNGGLFCFAGLFRNKLLGKYRAFATNPRNAVILRFPNRTVVITPEEPQSFVEMIESR